MTIDLRSLLAEIARTPTRTKALAVVCVLALAGVLAIAGVVAARPHFVTLYSGLDDAERVAVEKALAEGTVRYRVSQPPGPYSVYVDEGQYDDAQIVVALAEALRRSPSGINASDAGTSTIFMSSGERQQSMLKREWQETEHLLEQLDFISRATVTTSMMDSSPLRRREPVTVSVALKVRGERRLTTEEADNVAKLVRFRFGVPAENVLISDQSGRTLYDPTADGEGVDTRSLMEHSTNYDRELAAKVNSTLEQAFGTRQALVTVTSEWDHDQSTTLEQTVDPDSLVEVSTRKSQTKTPQGSPSPSVGGPAGSASNVSSGFGVDNAGFDTPSRASAGASASTSDEEKAYDASRSTTQTVRVAPRLKKLYVSLVIDEGLALKRDEIRSLVEAAVGFDPGRNDVIGVSTTTFVIPEGAAAAEDGDAGEAPAEETNGTLELLLQRGVEIVAALGFVIVLMLSLRGSKKAGGVKAVLPDGTSVPLGTPGSRPSNVAGAQAVEDVGPDEPDPDLVARMHIEELVRSDPRRVGEILSRWADDKQKAGAGR